LIFLERNHEEVRKGGETEKNKHIPRKKVRARSLNESR